MDNIISMQEIVKLYFNSKRSLIPLIHKDAIKIDGDLKRPLGGLSNWTDLNLHNFTLEYLIEKSEKGHGFGYRIKERELIIDVDVSGNKKGAESFKKLQVDLGIQLIPTVKTGSGGYHVYLLLPSNIDIKTFKIRNEYKEDYPDVEFKGYGRQVVIPGSPHISGNSYDLLDELAIVKSNPVPSPLINFFKSKNQGNSNLLENTNEDDLWGNCGNVTAISIEETKTHLKALDPSIYQEWIDVGMALRRQNPSKDGEYFQLFQTWSKSSKKYEEGKCVKKWDSFDKKYKDKPITVATLKYRYTLKYKNKEIIESQWWKEWVFDDNATSKPYVNIYNFQRKSQKGLEHNFRTHIPLNEKGKRIYPNPSILLSELNPVSVSNVVYRPDKPDGIFTEHNLSYLNEYSQANRPPVADSISLKTSEYITLFESHLLYLCDYDESSFKWLIQYLAFSVQYTGQIKGHGILIQGRQETGKTFISDIMVKILGERNCRELRVKDLLEPYTSWINNAALRFMEELKIPSQNRYYVDEILKTPLTNERVSVRAMYHETIEVKNVTNYIAFTNQNDAIPAYEGETRWFHITSSQHPKNKDYYKKLYVFDNDPQLISEMVKYFMDYPIEESFKVKQRAPMNRDKQIAIASEDMRFDWFPEIKTALSSKSKYYNKDVIILKQLYQTLILDDNDNEISITNKRLGKILRDKFDFAPYVNSEGKSAPINIDGQLVKVYVSKKYKNVTHPQQIRDLLTKPEDETDDADVTAKKKPKPKPKPTTSPTTYDLSKARTDSWGEKYLYVDSYGKEITINPENYDFQPDGTWKHKETGKIKKKLSKKDSKFFFELTTEAVPGSDMEKFLNSVKKEYLR